MSFTTKKFRKINIYEQKNLWIDCKSHSNLVELIEKDLNFEELRKFENSFEQYELLDIYKMFPEFIWFWWFLNIFFKK